MTMVPAPKLSNSKPHLVFYGGCCGAPADVMTRFADCCTPPAGYVSYNTTNIINGNTCTDTTTTTTTPGDDIIIANNNTNKLLTDNCVLGSDLGVPCYHPNNYGSYHNIFLMAEEEHSRTSNSTSVNDDGDQQQPAAATAAAASSVSIKGWDDTPTPPPHHHHHQRGIVDSSSSSSWLQLGLGMTHVDSPPPPLQQQYQTQAQAHQISSSSQMGAGGLMLELNLGGGGGGGGSGGNGGGSNSGGVIPLMMMPGLEPSRIIPQRQHQIIDHNHNHNHNHNLFIGSSTTYIPHHQQHNPMIPLIASLPQPQLQSSSHHLMLSDHHIQQQHQIGWGYANHQRAALSAATGYSSSLSPSSSSSMPPAVSGAGSFLTRPFTPSGSSSVDAVDSEFRVIHPPPRRPHTGIWFSLQASLHQSKQPFLPQVSKSFLRIKDERMTVRLVMKYVANKLGLDSESEVEIRCRGQQLIPYLTLQHVRDNIWSLRDTAVTTVTVLPDSSTTDHLMVLNYARSTSSSSTYLASST